MTQLEVFVATGVLGILATTALPSFQGLMERIRARGAAEGLYADMNYSKSEAIRRGVAVKVVITGGSAWSYCVTTDSCADGVLRSVSGGDFPGVTLTSTRALPLAVGFDPRRGTTGQSTTLTLQCGAASYSVVVSSMGRIRYK
ncbi:GspH/FimT family pseudopilin [Methylogaea oryzae]|uniref:Type II secretion system protein H n=2 Tax=Methylogaea oryzae TaxID=1295382 RepID=A0A8D4VL08_9GAMM|nr:GspH/FimT family pseudopilin [Methylogaea oryzae]BBL69472.1 hypothetical protein MoryE10_00780 [Methylogaea oryzae]